MKLHNKTKTVTRKIKEKVQYQTVEFDVITGFDPKDLPDGFYGCIEGENEDYLTLLLVKSGKYDIVYQYGMPKWECDTHLDGNWKLIRLN